MHIPVRIRDRHPRLAHTARVLVAKSQGHVSSVGSRLLGYDCTVMIHQGDCKISVCVLKFLRKRKAFVTQETILKNGYRIYYH